MSTILPDGLKPPGRPAAFKIPGLRWWILSLVFLATVINILDRLSVSILAPVIRERLHLTNFDYATVGTWFLLAYTISQGLSGLMHDRIGVKSGYAVSITLWSTAAMLHAFARDFLSLCLLRTLLGFGEGGNWPAAVKVITDWFPARERALALGIMNGGSSMGAVIAPPVIVWLQLRYGWQAVFLVTGFLGFVWLAAWLLFYRSRDQHPWCGADELHLICKDLPPAQTEVGRLRWLDLLRLRQAWAIILSRLCVDPIWWLYILWLPEYLSHARGMSLKQIGILAPLPFIAAGLGGVVGGAMSGWLIGRGWSVNRARKTVIVLAACLMPAGIFAAHADSALGALAWISVVTFAFQAWINNVQVLPSDIFPNHLVGSVAGLGGVGAGVGSMIFTLGTGWVVDHFSYTPVLVAAGFLGPLGTLLLFILLRKIEPLPVPGAA